MLHGRLIFISMGADNLQYICTQHRSGIRMYVCGPTLLNDFSYISVFLRLFFRLSPYIPCSFVSRYDQKISRYIAAALHAAWEWEVKFLPPFPPPPPPPPPPFQKKRCSIGIRSSACRLPCHRYEIPCSIELTHLSCKVLTVNTILTRRLVSLNAFI